MKLLFPPFPPRALGPGAEAPSLRATVDPVRTSEMSIRSTYEPVGTPSASSWRGIDVRPYDRERTARAALPGTRYEEEALVVWGRESGGGESARRPDWGPGLAVTEDGGDERSPGSWGLVRAPYVPLRDVSSRAIARGA